MSLASSARNQAWSAMISTPSAIPRHAAAWRCDDRLAESLGPAISSQSRNARRPRGVSINAPRLASVALRFLVSVSGIGVPPKTPTTNSGGSPEVRHSPGCSFKPARRDGLTGHSGRIRFAVNAIDHQFGYAHRSPSFSPATAAGLVGSASSDQVCGSFRSRDRDGRP